jgi:transposase
LHVLPPYSPELQPAERLWPLTNEPLANRHFPALDARQDVQAHHCLTLQAMLEVIRSDTNFHWWPQTA